MKHFVTLFSVLLLSAFAAQSQTTLSVAGKVYDVDTLFHAVVGPGTTQTSLQLSGPGKLRVFYVTIDRTNPMLAQLAGAFSWMFGIHPKNEVLHLDSFLSCSLC